jgi:glycerophosphoryl diester phosphodiesterase
MQMKKYIFLLSMLVVIMGCKQRPPTKEEAIQSASLLSPDRIVNIAHRGASGYSPEHTLSSYQTGEEMQGDYIEIDLQMTKDNTLIAMHDADVSRTTNGEGLVKDLTDDEIALLDAGSWFNQAYPVMAQPSFKGEKVPALTDIFDYFGTEANYYIETKTPEEYPNMVAHLLDVLEEYDLIGANVPEGKVVIQSFSKDSLKEIHQHAPTLPLILLLNKEAVKNVTATDLQEIKNYAVGVAPNYEALTKDTVQEMRAAGLLIHAYTVNNQHEMNRLIDWGVTGMFTNYPDRLEEVIQNVMP